MSVLRLVHRFCQRIRKAIAKIQPRRMPVLTVNGVRLASKMGLIHCE